jgi:hypothetical protein
LVFPFLIVLALSALPYFLAFNSSTPARFQKWLEQIQTEKEILPYLQSAQQLIEFQKTGLGAGQTAVAEEAIANLYFRLGEAILSRKDTVYLDAALDAYKKSIQQYPRLRHGWPYFQMGIVLEKLNRFPPAREQYRMVERYDYGLLALRAGYNAARISAQLQDQPVSAFDLYAYFRYASVNLVQEIQPFLDTAFQDGDEALYLKALIQKAQNQKSAAMQSLADYLKRKPTDPSARYYLDRLSQAPMQPLYPLDGNLSETCHAPRVYRNQNYLLSDDSHIRADVYIADPTHCTLAVDARCDNPDQTPYEIHFILNEDTRKVFSSSDTTGRFTAQFSTLQEVNHIELVLRILKEESDPLASPAYIHLREFHAACRSAEKPW